MFLWLLNEAGSWKLEKQKGFESLPVVPLCQRLHVALYSIKCLTHHMDRVSKGEANKLTTDYTERFGGQNRHATELQQTCGKGQATCLYLRNIFSNKLPSSA